MKKKRIILVVILILVIFFILLAGFFFKFNNEEEEDDSKEVLDLIDPVVVLLKEELNASYELRNGGFKSAELEDEEIIKYVFSRMSDDDFTIKKVKNKKIVCQVTKKISFNSSSTCTVYIVPNTYFITKENEYFGISKDLKFNDISYKGYTCKNDDKNYYCLKSSYSSSYLYFSYLDYAYRVDSDIYVYEYYLPVDLENNLKCTKYFSTDYCDNYEKYDKPSLDDDIIKRDGIYYVHHFVQNESGFYLVESSLVSLR